VEKRTQVKTGVGSLIFKTRIQIGYGVVIERGFWLDAAFREDPDKKEIFLQIESQFGKGSLLPIMMFGGIRGDRLVRKWQGDEHEIYLERFTCHNAQAGDIVFFPNIEMLQAILSQVAVYTGRKKKTYILNVQKELEVLRVYLNGGHGERTKKLKKFELDLFRLFEKALPRDLIGKTITDIDCLEKA